MFKRISFLFLLFFGLVAVLVWKQTRSTRSILRPNRDPWHLASDYSVRGLDLSHHNGKIIYEGLDSLDFVFLKATEGTSLDDRDFETH